ncbi:MAG: ATP-binding protease component ClpA [Gammaproteobacteria bacterium]|nr:ATP-binding protease component ClpA [Gammaproteobacteria bacterium]
MLNRELELTLNQAFKEARDRSHEYITVEHLLFSLLKNVSALDALLACGADVDQIYFQLSEALEKIPSHSPMDDKQEIQTTLGFKRVLQRALFHVGQSGGRGEVDGANVLAAIFSEPDSEAVDILKKSQVNRLDIVNYLSQGTATKSQELSSPFKSDNMHAPMGEEESSSSGGQTALETYTTNLNVLAMTGKIDPLVGREEEIALTIQALCRRRKNNPLLVGEAGVGKTAIAEGLAKLIVENKVPAIISHCTVYALDLGNLLAGTKYRGDFEKRFKQLIHELNEQPGAILFIDEIHTIVGAGAASGGVMDASNLIKPLLTSGNLKCIGATTYQEYRGIFEKDHALARRFQRVDISEPTVEQTYQILKGLRRKFEFHHGIRYSLRALRAAAELSSRFITDRFLPDKAIDIVDEAGAHQALQGDNRKKRIINSAEIEQVVAQMAHVPTKTVSTSDKEVLRGLVRDLKMMIFGQDEAIEALGSAIKLSRAGLREVDKPVGCFLLAGPTGVGKTEVTRRLAQLMGVELIRFDMSEYMEKHTVSRLIGAPPGYVGYDEGGLLTEAVTRHPYSVVLLDEIEKAHPDVYNLLLQVMDHGTLTDTNGRKANFRNVILIMTTNAGAEDLARNSVGFAEQELHSDALATIKRMFTPEFRNRLDAIVQFKPLDKVIVESVVNKFLMELEVQLEEHKIKLKVDDEAKQWLATHGYDEKMGARPMARLIQEKIKKPLADEMLFGTLVQGGTVRLQVVENDLRSVALPTDETVTSGS